jgi:predicted DNA-binding protein
VITYICYLFVDTCAMFSIGASFEAKLKIKGTSVILSKVHLERLNCLAKIRELRRKSRVPRILVELIEKGVCSEHDYELVSDSTFFRRVFFLHCCSNFIKCLA